MTRKRDVYAEAPPESPNDSLFAAVTEELREKYPDRVYSADAEAMRLVCLPVPAFAPRFLIQQEGWPLERFTMLVGVQEACKSAFAYELIRWHIEAGGGGIYVPTEPKESIELLRSIIGYEQKNVRLHERCKTTQEWNAAVKYWIEQFQTYMDGVTGRPGVKSRPGAGRLQPVCYVVDSIMANLAASTHKKIEEEGASGKHYADNAQLLDDWMKFVCPLLKGYPFSLVGINHLKPQEEQVTPFIRRIKRNIGGGMTPRFLSSLEIEMRRLTSATPGKEIDRVQDDERGIELEMLVFKNSLAPHERIKVEMLWFIDYEDRDPAGHFRQKTFFDWHAASVDILLDLAKGDGKRARRLRDIIDITADADKRRAWSSTLDVPQKSKVRYRELGELLEEKLQSDPGFANDLYAETGVRRRALFVRGHDFQTQMVWATALARGEQPAEWLQATGQAPAPSAAPEDAGE